MPVLTLFKEEVQPAAWPAAPACAVTQEAETAFVLLDLVEDIVEPIQISFSRHILPRLTRFEFEEILASGQGSFWLGFHQSLFLPLREPK